MEEKRTVRSFSRKQIARKRYILGRFYTLMTFNNFCTSSFYSLGTDGPAAMAGKREGLKRRKRKKAGVTEVSKELNFSVILSRTCPVHQGELF